MASVAPTSRAEAGLPDAGRVRVRPEVAAVTGGEPVAPPVLESTRMLRLTTGLAVAATTFASLAAFWPSVHSLVAFWMQIRDYEHAFLIAPIALGWMVVAIRPVASTPARPSLAGTVLLAALLFAWLVALNANSLILHQMLLPLSLWTAAWAGAGWHAARRLWLPVGFMYFAVPLWEYIEPVLQWMSVRATEGLLALTGVPVTVRENLVSIPEGTFRVVEGCSGKRYFMVALAVSVLAAALNRFRGWRAAAYVAAGGALAILANWIRIIIIIYAGHVTDMQHYLVAEEHMTFGNAIFVVLLIMIFVLARLFAGVRQSPFLPPEAAQDSARAGRSAWLLVPPLLLLSATFFLGQARARSTESPASLAPLPVMAGEWLGPLPGDRSWAPAYVGVDEEGRAAYTRGGDRVELYVNLYRGQKQEKELVFYGNTLLAPGAWARAWPQTTARIGDDLTSFEARGPGGDLWLVAHCFEVGGGLTRSEMSAQLTYGLKSVLRPVPAGVIALAVRCDGNCEAARALVESFWNDVSTSIRDVVPDGPTGLDAPGGAG